MSTAHVVRSLHRHPVKSVGGESPAVARVDVRGVAGDRVWALYLDDGGIASGKTTRRFRRVEGLLQWGAFLRAADAGDDDVPVLVAPDGREFRADDPAARAALAAAFGLALTPAREGDVDHFDDAPVHVVTTSSLAAAAQAAGGGIDARRTRANVVVDTGDAPEWLEDGWLGRDLALGPEVVLRVTAPMPRCVMVDMAHRHVDPGRALLKPLGRVHDVELGVMADVVRPGRVAVGDPVALF